MSYDALLRFILLDVMFDCFELVDFKPGDQKVHIHFDEQNLIPEEYSIHQLESNGF